MPFLDENDNEEYYTDDHGSDFSTRRESSLIRGDKRFYLIGGVTSVIAFLSIIVFIYNSNKPIDLGELPVIRAETTPLRVKPASNKQVEHQDKLVYDNISGDTRVLKEHVAPDPEEPSLDDYSYKRQDDVLSQEERESIIREFDELAPKTSTAHTSLSTKKDINRYNGTEELQPTVNRAETNRKKLHKNIVQKLKKNSLLATSLETSKKGTIMVQVASVNSKTAAEAEYSRLLRKNKFLRGSGKKIVKIDLGPAGGIKYRVQVGPFKSRKEASKVISIIKNNGFSAYISR